MKAIDFRLRQLECFVTVADTLNFSKAAKVLFMTQPTLSTQIKSLEEEFGSALFERSRSHVKLTPSGEILLVTAQRILAEIEDLSTHIHTRQEGLRLRLAVDSDAMMYLIPTLARKIKSLAPSLKLLLSEAPSEIQFSQLLDGRVDALVGRATAPHRDIVFHPTSSDYLVAAVPIEHHLAGRSRISIKDLAHETILVAAAQDCRQHRTNLQELFRPFEINPFLLEISTCCTSHLSMVAAGMGISLVPHSLEQISFPFISFVPFSEDLPLIQFGISHRRSSVSISLDILMRALRDSQVCRPKKRLERERDSPPHEESSSSL